MRLTGWNVLQGVTDAVEEFVAAREDLHTDTVEIIGLHVNLGALLVEGTLHLRSRRLAPAFDLFDGRGRILCQTVPHYRPPILAGPMNAALAAKLPGESIMAALPGDEVEKKEIRGRPRSRMGTAPQTPAIDLALASTSLALKCADDA